MTQAQSLPTEVELIADPIADLRSATGSLISVYVDRPTPGGFAALLSDLLRPIKDKAERLDRQVAKQVRVDADMIHDLADGLEVEAAPAYAIFASGIDDVFLIEQLTHEVPNVAMLGPRPYMRPMRAAPRSLRSAVLVADRGMARTFIGSGGLVEETGEPIENNAGKSNFGGFSGYSEHTARLRTAEQTARMWKEAGQRLLDLQLRRPFDYLALGGHEESMEEVARSLHTYLARLPRASFAATPSSITVPAIRAELADSDDQIRRQRQEALAGRVCDTAWSGGYAVLGLNDTLDAVNAQAVDTLVVAGEYRRGGSVCHSCGHLTRNGVRCPVCGSRMFEIEDLVAAVMESVITSGGRVHQIGVPSPLDDNGVGALTRFPVPG